jgi:phosphatidylglycerol---prolipoprotein diacylglyceryl transferase
LSSQPVILFHSTTGAQAHIVLEAAAYAIGARVYWANARKTPRPDSLVDRWVLLACVLFGAALGSKLLHVAEHIGYFTHGASSYEFLGGKSILGGLVGGTLGAEAGKRWVGWHASTGDAWVPAIGVGLIIGRIGCQFSGLWDGTFGSPTTLPWGWDYGDGVARHPTALYEILAVAACWALVDRVPRQPAGARFAAFLAGYCLIRLLLEFVKPPFGGDPNTGLPVSILGGLTAIQWLALLGFLAYLQLYRYRRRTGPSVPA